MEISHFKLFDTVNCLRFPLIVLVVAIHSHVSEFYDNMSWETGVESFIGRYFASGAVPTFFFISGLLFCREGLSIDLYKHKLKSRVNTLLRPYVIWSLIAFIILSFKYLPLFEVFFDNRGDFLPYSFQLFYRSFYDKLVPDGTISDHTPLNFPLWYVRDLIVLVLISPVIYYFKQYSGFFLVVISVFCSYTFIRGYEYQFYSILFYSLGVFCPPQKINMNKRASEIICVKLFIVFIFLYYIGEFVLDSSDSVCVEFIIKLLLIPFFIYSANAFVLSGKKIPSVLTNSSFFIFCFHGLFIGDLKILLVKVFGLNKILPEILFFFFVIFLSLSISLLFYLFFKNYSPKLLSVMCGGRI